MSKFPEILDIVIATKNREGGLHGFYFGGMELPTYQNLATNTKQIFKNLLLPQIKHNI